MKLKNTLLTLLVLAAAMPASAGEMDMLLYRLAEKNVIAPAEVREIKAAERPQPKAELPSWLQTMKFHGDMRLRAESVDNNDRTGRESRGRIRLRAGAAAAVNDTWTVGLGLASGSSADSRSTNQTLTSNFSKKDLYLDYAYAEYKGANGFSFTGGRMHNPFWTSNDMLWDGDINPEGAAFKLASQQKSGFRPFAAGAWFALDESASSSQAPFLAAGQAGFKWSGADKLDFTAAMTYYDFANVKGRGELANRPSTASSYVKSNTLAGSVYKYNYDSLAADVELNKGFAPVNIAGTGLKLDYAGLFGGGVKATDHSRQNAAWIAGFKLGQRKVEEAGQWQFRYSLRRLEAEAWLDTYPDSDFYGGSTGVKGSEMVLTLGVARNMNVEADYYSDKRISDTSKREHLLQADLNLKF